MSYQALYRKYRPKDFLSVKGQEHIVTTLANQLKSERIGHAYLFCGTRGTGKTTVAKIFAKAINCENPSEKGPCGQCPMCQAIEKGNSMNVIEIDAASNNKVDDVRQIIEEVQYSPAQGKYKVYVIDEVHMMSTSAFNALLKTIEEPPSYLVFILATTDPQKIPLTILSRCQRYDFKRISVDTIVLRLRELLEKENVEAEEEALNYIARQADGALRDGLSLLEQCISYYFGEKLTYEKVLEVLGAVDHEVYHRLMEALIKNDTRKIMEIVAGVVEKGRELTQFINEFVWYMRNVLIIKSTQNYDGLIDMSKDNIEELKKISENLETEMLFRYIRILSALVNEMRYSNNKRIMVEVAFIKLCHAEMEKDNDSILNRVHNLEQKQEEIEEDIESGSFLTKEALANLKNDGFSSLDNIEVGEAKKKIRPEAVPEDVKEVVANWDRAIMPKIGSVDRTMLETARLSVSDNGILTIVFGEEVRADRFQRPEVLQSLIDTIGQVIGKEVKIDIKCIKGSSQINQFPDLKKVLDLDQTDIPIEIVD